MYFVLCSKRIINTLPKTNIYPPQKIFHPKRKIVFQPSFFRCYVSFREGNFPAKNRKVTGPEDSSKNSQLAAFNSWCVEDMVLVVLFTLPVGKALFQQFRQIFCWKLGEFRCAIVYRLDDGDDRTQLY